MYIIIGGHLDGSDLNLLECFGYKNRLNVFLLCLIMYRSLKIVPAFVRFLKDRAELSF